MKRRSSKKRQKRKGDRTVNKTSNSVKSRSKGRSRSSGCSVASTSSSSQREATWNRWKEYIDSSLSNKSTSGRCTSPYATYNDYSELSSRSSSKAGILKSKNSGPTCEMPVRFRLPNSSRIVYPTKSYEHIGQQESSSDSDSSTYHEVRYY